MTIKRIIFTAIFALLFFNNSGCANTAHENTTYLSSNLTDKSNTNDENAILTAEDTRALYNKYISNFDNIWLRTTYITNLTYDDQPYRETGEAYIMIIPRENKLIMSINSKGQSIVTIGCNDEEYWIIDRSNKKAWVGRSNNHSSKFSETLVGVIHPLDILALLAMQPIPPESKVVKTKSTFGGHQYRFELPKNANRPFTTIILSANGELDIAVELARTPSIPLATSRLWNFQPLTNGEALIPQRITFDSPILKTTMSIEISKINTAPLDEELFSVDTHIKNIPESNITINENEP